MAVQLRWGQTELWGQVAAVRPQLRLRGPHILRTSDREDTAMISPKLLCGRLTSILKFSYLKRMIGIFVMLATIQAGPFAQSQEQTEDAEAFASADSVDRYIPY